MSSLLRRIQRKPRRRGKAYKTGLPNGSLPKMISSVPAYINRRTGQPHQNAREMARRRRQMGGEA